MRPKHLIVLIPLLLLGACTRLCTPIPKCGDFTFIGTKVDTSEENGVDMNLSFDFNPVDCGSKCACDPVCYIQIVRTVDLETGTYIYPSSEKEDRATTNGWYIDRIPNRIWGYYGRNDDGGFAGNLDPGSATEPTILFDRPSRGEAEPWLQIWWQAVSTPVCIQPRSGCENRLLGYYFWSWAVNNDGTTTDPVHAVAWQPLENEVDAAVGEWNIQAPGLGKNSFPAFTRLAP